ncbi:Threonine aldolase [Modicella reniformis]|uniref:Threonine aldolase n=1 Tax=Modicella reniformis TaxID=1440133 RepID=A0A9P6IMC5_9FUNG|nr:Threonine aldolase [Modicella reniformis]
MQKSKTFNPLAYSDFRSDTATAPTPDMFAAMMKSSLGDDVFNEDDSIKALERYVATLCGHEAAIYCTSGTMSNQLAHRVHLSNPPQSAMVDIRSHVFNYEAGGISFHSQAAVYPIMPSNGQYLTAEDIASRLVLDVDVHYAPTRSISLENTLNGTIMPIEEMVRIRELSLEHGVKLHLDGARLWHASIATGIPMKEYCSHFDTISLCLSKGIGAPIGSILVGSEDTIKKARHFRLLFGGGWRQAGFLAEAALWCIKTNWPTMEETHRQARWLERAFRQVGCHITNPVDTNMVWIDTSDAGFTVEELMAELAKENIKISGSGYAARIVLHYQISNEVISKFVDVLRRMSSAPQMKVAVDMANTPLASCVSESDGEISPSTPAPYYGLPSPKKLMLKRSDNKPEDDIFEEMASPLPRQTSFEECHHNKHKVTAKAVHAKSSCLFQETNGSAESLPAISNSASVRKSRRPLSSSLSSPSVLSDSNGRPANAYGSLSRGLLERIEKGQEDEDGQYKCRYIDQEGLTMRRTQSLDLVETLEQAAYEKDMEQARIADAKKMTKLQYHLSHNPASKAIKRASVRIVSLLSRESYS